MLVKGKPIIEEKYQKQTFQRGKYNEYIEK